MRPIAILLCALAGVLALPAAAQEAPFVTVSEVGEDGAPVEPANTAWWLLPMTIRPTGNAVLGIPIAALNAHRARTVVGRPAPWCHASLLSDRSYAASNPALQASIDQSFRDNPDHRFDLSGRFTGGKELRAVLGHFADCSGRTGSFILIADPAASPPSIVHLDVLPYESGLQYMRLIDGRITVSTCFECGDVTGLFYDPRRRRFRWRSLGD